ncbi:MAG: OB-fold putative lipoprotein [Bacteroidales bacterium]|nr:OB-fold putative lipoprotein [Bacteroidales bacterium]
MFEIDENTKYSLRLIGRGSVILVSIALMLALIGYFQRDKSPAINENEFLFVEFISVNKEAKTQLLDQRIIVSGVIDSIYIDSDQVTALLKDENSSKTLQCYFLDKSETEFLETDQKYNIEGIFSSFNDTGFKFRRCRLIE